MIRKIISIEEDMCDGCGLCIEACHENAIGIVEGKAKLLREDYCDGLGDCLPACPQNAITFIEKELDVFDDEEIESDDFCESCIEDEMNVYSNMHEIVEEYSELKQWPVQIKLVAVNADFFDDADLLIAADCSAYAYGNFHQKFMKDRVTLIGCPKLDGVNYADKLTDIFENHEIQSIMIVKMEVFCCNGLEKAVMNAIEKSNKDISCQIITISSDGKIIDEKRL